MSTFYWQLARCLVFARAASSHILNVTETSNISVWYVSTSHELITCTQYIKIPKSARRFYDCNFIA